MNDLKLYSKNISKLEDLHESAKRFSGEIGMGFGCNKCTK